MAGSQESVQDAIRVAEKILTLLDEGRFTATYKYAVLLGLIDLCLVNTAPPATPPDSLTKYHIAEKIVEIYWPQSAQYEARDGGRVLKQNEGRRDSQAEILSAITKFREASIRDPSASLFQARRAAPGPYKKLLQEVEWKLIEMPLPRLQVIGNKEDAFPYTIRWDQHVRRADVSRYQRGESHAFDNRIYLNPKVGEYLVQLNTLLRPFIYRQWAAKVAHINGLEEYRLEKFLFGAERISTEAVRAGLQEIQRNRCFYCESGLANSPPTRPVVDHFIPWSRYPDNGIENLVIAHERCNSFKRDFLAGHEHVIRWAASMRNNSDGLERLAEREKWERHPDRTLSVARAIYLRLPDDASLWGQGREFVTIDRRALERALGS